MKTEAINTAQDEARDWASYQKWHLRKDALQNTGSVICGN